MGMMIIVATPPESCYRGGRGSEAHRAAWHGAGSRDLAVISVRVRVGLCDLT